MLFFSLFPHSLELGISSLNNLLLKESNRSWEIQVGDTFSLLFTLNVDADMDDRSINTHCGTKIIKA